MHTHSHIHNDMHTQHTHTSAPPTHTHTHTHPSAQNSSDLTSLVQIMCATFADKCPVYAKPPPGRAPPQHAHSQPSSYPPPPMGGYPGYGPPPLTGFPPNPGYASGYSGGYGQPPYPVSSMPSYPTGAYRPPGMPVPTPPVGNTGPGSYNYGSYQPTASVGPSPFPGTSTCMCVCVCVCVGVGVGVGWWVCMYIMCMWLQSSTCMHSAVLTCTTQLKGTCMV